MLLVQSIHLQESIFNSRVVDNSVNRQQLETKDDPLDLIDDVVETEQCKEETHNNEDNHQLDDQTHRFSNLELYEIFQLLMNLVLDVNHRREVYIFKRVLQLDEFRIRE